MKVKELIAELQKCDQEKEVLVHIADEKYVYYENPEIEETEFTVYLN